MKKYTNRLRLLFCSAVSSAEMAVPRVFSPAKPSCSVEAPVGAGERSLKVRRLAAVRVGFPPGGTGIPFAALELLLPVASFATRMVI